MVFGSVLSKLKVISCSQLVMAAVHLFFHRKIKSCLGSSNKNSCRIIALEKKPLELNPRSMDSGETLA